MQYLTKKTLVILAVLCIPGAWTFGLVGIAPVHAANESCPNRAYRTGPSANLPDCRAYELVTPPQKDSGKLYFTGVGTDEETLSFTSLAGFAGAESGEGLPGFAYVAQRGEGEGWQSSSVAPSAARFLDLQAGNSTGRVGPAAGHSGDLRTTLWLLHEYGQAENTAGLYLTRPGGAVTEVGPALPPGAESVLHEKGEAGAPVKVEGLSADASRVVFRSGVGGSKGFVPADAWGAEAQGLGPLSLLEYIGTGDPAPIPLVPDPVAEDEGCASQLVGGELQSEAEFPAGKESWSHNAMSSTGEGAGGRTVFFTDMCPGTHQIFARVENGEAGAHTVAISEPSAEACSACGVFKAKVVGEAPPEAYFVGASTDGSRVFFTMSQPLLGGDSSENLYEYDLGTRERVVPEGKHLIRVSAGDGTVANPAANVEGVVQVSEDGSHVYFIAGGVLTENPNSRGQVANSGGNNLYVFDTETSTTAFIATLPASDARLWKGDENLLFPQGSDVTPDGRFLVFTSHGDLTADDTSTASQVFEYDAQTGTLVRVSIGEDGYNEDGNTHLVSGPKPRGGSENDGNLEDHHDAHLPEQTDYFDGAYSASAYTQELGVSENGAYVFFESSDGLTPQALDFVQIHPVVAEQKEEEFGPLYAENVYEYHAGNVYLISDGQDVAPSEAGSYVSLHGTDPSGRDVFFTTTDSLVGQDTDTNADIYDARIDGGFPSPSGYSECEGDACQGGLSAAPVLLSPGSEFQAGGNPPLAVPAPVPAVAKAKPKAKPRKCKQGETRRHGKCVRQKARKSDRRRKS